LWGRLADFLVPELGGDLRFSHDLVRRVAYEGLPFGRRRELHLRIARALVPRGQPDDARLGLLALHFDRSGDHATAWRYNRLAAQRAWDKYATVEATAFFQRAIDNGRQADGIDPGELASAFEAMGDVALLAGRYDLAREGFRGARRLLADGAPLARLCRKEGTLREKLGKHAAAVSWFRKGLAALDAVTDDIERMGERSRLEMACASTLIWQQRYKQCAAWCERALPDALASGDQATEAHAYYLLEWALGELGDGQAHRYRNLAQPIYERLGDYAGLASVLNNRGVDALVAGRWDECCARFEESRTARRRAGDIVGMAQCGHNLAEVCVEQGRYTEAEAYLREARRIWRASGYSMGVAAATNTLGRCMGRTGRIDDAVGLLRDAVERFVALGHGPFLAETEARLAEVLVFGGRLSEALEVLDHLGERADEGGPPVAALALRMRGTLTARLGREDEARELLERARTVADKGGAEWESALAAWELARLGSTEPDEREFLSAQAGAVLERMGIDASVVVPPRP
jgi:tetratricopeptide (TPR) repeat protein